jgi:hypothetical protein
VSKDTEAGRQLNALIDAGVMDHTAWVLCVSAFDARPADLLVRLAAVDRVSLDLVIPTSLVS